MRTGATAAAQAARTLSLCGLVPGEQADGTERVSDADKIVLLYPDAIGLGFGAVKQSVARHKRGWASAEVLNGQRRLLEWSMLPELLFLPAWVKKPWARRFGWSLWAFGHKN